MKRKWASPLPVSVPFDTKSLGDAAQLDKAELKIRLEDGGISFNKKFCAKTCYIHRRIAESDVLISVSQNIADFNGYIELNPSAAFLWDELQSPRTSNELEKALADRFSLSREQAVRDVMDFLEELRKHCMVEIT